jgi:hypothetical protein
MLWLSTAQPAVVHVTEKTILARNPWKTPTTFARSPRKIGFCKSWQGEAAMTTTPGTVPRVFQFCTIFRGIASSASASENYANQTRATYLDKQ